MVVFDKSLPQWHCTSGIHLCDLQLIWLDKFWFQLYQVPHILNDLWYEMLSKLDLSFVRLCLYQMNLMTWKWRTPSVAPWHRQVHLGQTRLQVNAPTLLLNSFPSVGYDKALTSPSFYFFCLHPSQLATLSSFPNPFPHFFTLTTLHLLLSPVHWTKGWLYLCCLYLCRSCEPSSAPSRRHPRWTPRCSRPSISAPGSTQAHVCCWHWQCLGRLKGEHSPTTSITKPRSE